MLEQTERISFRNSSVLSKVELEPEAGSGSYQKVPVPTGPGSATLKKTAISLEEDTVCRNCLFFGSRYRCRFVLVPKCNDDIQKSDE